mmetsp:Transcript_3399/g.7957  ORF Transcript_3399/g.7957 Transcript_3399/m.7957 type:complete len:89 (+) Transcript_3399:982-1248(+)
MLASALRYGHSTMRKQANTHASWYPDEARTIELELELPYSARCTYARGMVSRGILTMMMDGNDDRSICIVCSAAHCAERDDEIQGEKS